MKYIHMPIFLSLPASPGLWPQVCVPQEAPLKQAWGCKEVGVPRETHKHPLFLGRAPSGVHSHPGLATSQQGMAGEGHFYGSRDPSRWGFGEAGLGES